MLDQVGPTPFLDTLWSWTQAITNERGLTPVRKHVTTMTARLTAHLPWICEQDWVVDFAEEIGDLVRATPRITMTEPRRELLKGVTCPSCGMTALVRHFPGDWAAECRNCPSVKLDDRYYEALVKTQAERAHDAVNT
ncbi:hypothetical protein GQF42_16020 [Streptomyces broussonetiae]|uniref:Uncharacterized protein n=1 Tax=Streptomyces broussonetiae TaxID=2686304 RepID=A0A6I6N805_9ACTN|nr:hypothetical protein [Streptomyces broussonetiae]QHA04597.1 hypothetical protein GQF42_16020 [Streptomyces broussonetiae]